MYSVLNNGVAIDQTKAFQYLEEKTNVKWEVQSGSILELGTKRDLLLATDQYPDVFFKAGFTQNEVDVYGTQGIFIPLNTLIDNYAPNLKKILIEKPFIKDYITSEDGNIYSMPMINPMQPALSCVFINQTWLEHLGLKEPKNLDELYHVLKEFKDKDANQNGDKDDEIPISGYTGTILYSLLPYFGVNFDYATKTAAIDNVYQYVPSSTKYKEFLTYLKRLYEEKILDPLAFSQTVEQYSVVGKSGDLYGIIISSGPVLVVGREKSQSYPILTPFDPNVFPVKSGAGVGAFVITDKCKYPEVAMTWVDQFYTEEGGRLAWMGIEDESYRINQDGTWEWILSDQYKDITSLRQNYTLQGMAQMPVLKPELWIGHSTDAEDNFIVSERNRVIKKGAQPFPSLKFNTQDNEAIATITADINPYIENYMVSVVTGELDLEDSWNGYLKTLDKMGLSKLMSIYTNAYNKATKK